MSETYKLKTPVVMGEERCDEITIKPPIGKLLMQYEVRLIGPESMKSATFGDLCKYLLACGVPEWVVERMTAVDLDEAAGIALPFFIPAPESTD